MVTGFFYTLYSFITMFFCRECFQVSLFYASYLIICLLSVSCHFMFLELWITQISVWDNKTVSDSDSEIFYSTQSFVRNNCRLFNVLNYKRMIRVIPVSLRSMVKQDILYLNISPGLRQLCIEGIDLRDSICTGKVIRNILGPSRMFS